MHTHAMEKEAKLNTPEDVCKEFYIDGRVSRRRIHRCKNVRLRQGNPEQSREIVRIFVIRFPCFARDSLGEDERFLHVMLITPPPVGMMDHWIQIHTFKSKLD